MKSLRKCFGILSFCSLCILFTACPGSDETDDIIDDQWEYQDDKKVDYSKTISENVSVSAAYSYYTFTVELYTYLTDAGKPLAGRSDVKYGIEWSYSNRKGVYSYYLDPKNHFMETTKVSSNHYSVIVTVFCWDEDDTKTTEMNFYSLQYYGLKKKEKEEGLDKNEKSYLATLEKTLNPYMSEVNAYRGKVFVEIGGERYYVKSFKK